MSINADIILKSLMETLTRESLLSCSLLCPWAWEPLRHIENEHRSVPRHASRRQVQSSKRALWPFADWRALSKRSFVISCFQTEDRNVKWNVQAMRQGNCNGAEKRKARTEFILCLK